MNEKNSREIMTLIKYGKIDEAHIVERWWLRLNGIRRGARVCNLYSICISKERNKKKIHFPRSYLFSLNPVSSLYVYITFDRHRKPKQKMTFDTNVNTTSQSKPN